MDGILLGLICIAGGLVIWLISHKRIEKFDKEIDEWLERQLAADDMDDIATNSVK